MADAVRINLDVAWSADEWLYDMRPAARLAWVELLCYVKARGVRGSVRALSPRIAADRFRLALDDIAEMLNAAVAAKALIIDGDEWRIADQSPLKSDAKAAERVRKHREKQKIEPTDEDVTLRNVTSVTETDVTLQALRNVTPSPPLSSPPSPSLTLSPPTPPIIPPTPHSGDLQFQNPATPPQGQKSAVPDFVPGEMRGVAEEWASYRRERRLAAWTSRSWQIAVNKFRENPEAWKWAAQQSMAQGWQGIFPDKYVQKPSDNVIAGPLGSSAASARGGTLPPPKLGKNAEPSDDDVAYALRDVPKWVPGSDES